MNKPSVWIICALLTTLIDRVSARSESRKVYVSHHTEIEVEEGSPEWESFSKSEREKFLSQSAEMARSGKPAKVTDYLIIQKKDADHIKFCVLHVGHLLHSCFLSGEAKKEGAGFSYIDSEIEGCRLNINENKGKITIEDINSVCRQNTYCGARAYFDEAEFSEKDLVTDAKQLKEAERECPTN